MGSERCGGCGHLLPDRALRSPEVRRCEDCWWAEARRAHAAGEPVHPLALPIVAREMVTDG